MGRATLILDADVSALRRAMGEIPGITQRAQAVMTSQARRGGAERLTAEQQFTREHEAIHIRLARAAEKRLKDQTAKEKAEGRKRVQADGEFARLKDSIHKQLAAEKDRREKAATRSEEAEGRKRVRSAGGFAREHDRIHQAMIAGRLRRLRESIRSENEARRAESQFLGGAPSALAGAALNVGAQFADYGDDLRVKRRAREQVSYRATQIASGDIGDVNAAPQLMAATEAVSRLTGLDPQGVIDAIGDAQSKFSNLANAADRGSYLGQVLPMLGRAAVATNSSLTDMVAAAGEFQRQFNIGNADLPRAISQAIAEGRLGSVGFRDYAAHAGTLAGAGTRSFSNAPADSMNTRAVVGGLFQFAGRAGGGGGQAATRTQAFLNNLSSTRGQRALTEGLGYNPYDASGQIARRQGETQVDAFQRIAQDAYRLSGGNAGNFLNMFAGNRDEARSLGDQMFQDMRRNGGNLTEFRRNIDQSLGATTQDAVGAPFDALARTPLLARSRREVGDFWNTSGASSDFAGDTERQREEFARAHPFIARVQDNPASRAAYDVTNYAFQGNSASAILAASPDLPQNSDRAARQMQVARDAARAHVREYLDPLHMGWSALANPAATEQMVQAQTPRELARLQLGDQARAQGQSPLTISEDSINRLAERLAASMSRSPITAVVAPDLHGDAHANSGARPAGGRIER